MKTRIIVLITNILPATLFVFLAMSASAAVRYVDVNSVSPSPPYTNWATAAPTIQAAVDVAVAGDEIVVTNGVYQTGGRAVYGTMTNRVAVDKPVTVHSVNGPEVTLIDGAGAVRCVYLTNGATLRNFTLTNGIAYIGGGVWCESASAVVSNCVLTGNAASGDYFSSGGGAYRGTLNNCTLRGNSASGYAFSRGGGAAEATLNNCTLTNNSAEFDGGGALSCTLNNCTLTGNSAQFGSGGGAYESTLNNCTLAGNKAYSGGGASSGMLDNCTLTGNSADFAGGASGGTLNNCIVYYNVARQSGANYSGGIFNYSCTTPLPPGGSANISAEPQMASTSHLSVGSPCLGTGSPAYSSGLDIDGEPWANPPSIGCDEIYPEAQTGSLSVAIQASFTNVATGFEIDFTAVIGGYVSASRWEFGDGAVVSNRPYATHSWQGAGDYLVVLRAYNLSYPGGVSATATVHVVSQPVHYVAAGSGSPVAPYISWATAASTIQEAVDAAFAGGTILVSNGVYQTGGRVVFGTMTNRVAVTKPLTLRSVNGPDVTVIDGVGAVRCVNLPAGATLVGFTLTNGLADNGGGVYCESPSAVVSHCVLSANLAYSSGGGASGGTLTNCTLTGNSAYYGGGAVSLRKCRRVFPFGSVCHLVVLATLNNCVLTGNSADFGGGGAGGATLNNCTLSDNSARSGGGAASLVDCPEGGCHVHVPSTLNNCTLSGNSAYEGGGAYYGTLNNCTLGGNSAEQGGGAYLCTLNNCIVYSNTASDGANYFDAEWASVILTYCCTLPLPTNGVGNFTNAPLFVDQAGGNLRLQSDSPCINSGLNAYAPAGPDLDGNPRIVGGTVDVGAYEFQSPQSAISYAWLQSYALPTDGSVDFTDPDADGHNNWQEWRCLTDPTNALSVLRLLSPVSGAPGVIVSWQSVSGRTYFLERDINFGAQPALGTLASNLIGQAGTTIYTDTNAVGAGPFFYRVGLQE